LKEVKAMIIEKNKSVAVSLLKFIKLLPKKEMVLYIIFALLYSCQGIVIPVIIQMAGHIDSSDSWDLIVFTFSSISLWVVVYAFMYIENILLRSIIRAFNVSLSENILKNHAVFPKNISDSELCSLLTQDLGIVDQEFLQSFLISPVWGASVLVSVTYLLKQNIIVGSLFTVGAFLMILPQFIFKRKLKESGELLSSSKEKNLRAITDFGKGIETIICNQAEKENVKQTLITLSEMETTQFKYYTLHNLVMFWTGPLKAVGLIGPFVIGLVMKQNSITTLIAMMSASTYLINPLQQILEAIASIQASQVIKDKLLTFGSESEIPSKGLHIHTLEEIQLKNVTKSYDNQEIFRDVTVTFSLSQHNLIVGDSGIGKTTLFRLISGQDKAYSGKIIFKSIDGRELTPNLDNIAIIHQNPYVFHTSVRYNLTLYQDYSDSLLISTLKKVGLWEACCHQLDYELTGDNFSGGQIIKLEIARAILRGKQVILADEMMASLDAASSKEISNVLKQLPNSIIEIAHHYNLEDYDAVYRIENKSIVRIK
jgi:ATP-binding cassette, subfamily C, bacterial